MKRTNAAGATGCLLENGTIFRVYTNDDKSEFIDYTISHFDLQVTISPDELAEFVIYDDGTAVLDETAQTLGYGQSEPKQPELPIVSDFAEKREIMKLIGSFDDAAYDLLGERVQCNVSGDDAASDVEVALEQAIAEDARIFPVKDENYNTWYIIAKTGQDALQQVLALSRSSECKK
jgi:hypothetical protein